MPKRSSLARAYSRHSDRTSHPTQTFLASRVEPPFSGKNASGSVCAHSERSCQDSSPSSASPVEHPVDHIEFVHGFPPRPSPVAPAVLRGVQQWNYTRVMRPSSSRKSDICPHCAEGLIPACRPDSPALPTGADRLPPCASRPSPAASAGPASSAACATTSTARPDLADSDGHRHRQHRRRHHPVRPAGLPRPRHPPLHARRRRARGAGLGPRRREPPRAGRARGLRRRPAVVRPRRPRLRHPRRALAVARPGRCRSARSPPGSPRAGACPSSGIDAAADDRRPGRDPRRRRRRARAASARSTSRSGGSGTRRRCRRSASSSPGSTGHRRPRRARRDPPGRRRAAAAEQPGRLDRHHPRRARACAMPCAAPRSRRRRLAAHLRAPRPRPRRRLPARPSASSRPRTAVAGLYEDFLDGWLVDPDDDGGRRWAARLVEVLDRPLLMTDVDAAADIAGARPATSPSSVPA